MEILIVKKEELLTNNYNMKLTLNDQNFQYQKQSNLDHKQSNLDHKQNNLDHKQSNLEDCQIKIFLLGLELMRKN